MQGQAKHKYFFFISNFLFICAGTKDIKRGSQTSYRSLLPASCNGILSRKSPLGVFQVLTRRHTCKQKDTNALMISAHIRAIGSHVVLLPAFHKNNFTLRSQKTHAPDEYFILITNKPQIPHIRAPC